MKILAIGAHPDDVEFGCGALLIKEVRAGSQVKILVLSRGEAGTAGTPQGREQESRAAAALIGAEIEFLEMGGDCHIQNTPANGFALARHIRQEQPDIILAPHIDENQHPDHAAAGKLCREAARFARYGGLAELKDLPVHKITGLYYYPVTQDFGRPVDIVIDTTEAYEQWSKVILSHQSQLSAKAYLDLVSARARALGAAIGTGYAQGLWQNDPVRLDRISELTLSSRNY
ncbi:MAG TPA: PIG-L family deacetylase [Patescibacteria group bacterium]|nr:PIG-L family deacetylase [Patescibacteria group bacterium]